MRHWGEYRRLREALRPAMAPWWRRTGRPWGVAAIAVGVLAAFSTIPLYVGRQPPEAVMFLLIGICSLLGFLAGFALTLLWLAAAQRADAALDNLAAGAGLPVPAHEGRLRLMAYLSQGGIPLLGAAALAVCQWLRTPAAEFLVFMRWEAARRLGQDIVTLEDVLRLIERSAGAVLGALQFAVILFALLAVLRKWKAAFAVVIGLQVLELLLIAGIQIFHSGRDIGTFHALYQSVPLKTGWLAGAAVLAALCYFARRRFTGAAAALIGLYFAGAVALDLQVGFVPGPPPYTPETYRPLDFAVSWLAAPYRFILHAPFDWWMYSLRSWSMLLGLALNAAWVALLYWLALRYTAGDWRLGEVLALYRRAKAGFDDFLLKSPSGR